MSEKANVLVVDDDESIAVTLEEILRREGYNVTTARSGKEASALIFQQEFDVALLDLRLGDMDGMDVLGTLKTHQSNTVAIILTGYASLESAVEAIRQGAYEYLIKPCDLDELRMTVKRGVERRAMDRSVQQHLDELQHDNAQFRRFATELQSRADAATAELSRRIHELNEVRRQLEDAHRQREEFIRMIVHEIRQPLTLLNTYAELLSLMGEGEQPPIPHGSIIFAVQRLRRLAKDLSDASSLRSGHFRVNLEPSDFAHIVERQVEIVRESNPSRVIHLESASAPLIALCDVDRVGQVIANLLDNAIKYGGRKDVSVRVDRVGDEAQASVRDEGPGLPPERIESLFEPYVRLEGQSPARAEGMGLGLYIARGIVQAHGGRIDAESVPGEGTTFTVRLPLTVPAKV